MIDLVGIRFGKLVVVERLGNDKHNKTRWMCKCDCGNLKEIGGWDLRAEHSKSCGCLRTQTLVQRNLKAPYFWIFTMAKQHAVASNKSFELEYEDILDFVKINKCHYCETELVWEKHGVKGKYHGYRLDRVNNDLGYMRENCVVCCTSCNRIKGNQFTHDEMLTIGKFVKSVIDKRVQYEKRPSANKRMHIECSEGNSSE